MELKGSKTEKNLMAAFSGESEARNKYTYFASVAKKEGYEQISELFLDTANNEKEHAKMWFKELKGIGNTAENLKSAAAGENYEWTDMYATFAKEAEEERIVFIESAILYESGFDSLVDKVIMVYADEDVRIERSMKRDGADRAAIEERIKNQSSDKDKRLKADFVLHNNPDDNINKQIFEIIKKLY